MVLRFQSTSNFGECNSPVWARGHVCLYFCFLVVLGMGPRAWHRLGKGSVHWVTVPPHHQCNTDGSIWIGVTGKHKIDKSEQGWVGEDGHLRLPLSKAEEEAIPTGSCFLPPLNQGAQGIQEICHFCPLSISIWLECGVSVFVVVFALNLLKALKRPQE